jgi:hypothetical protein
VAGSQLPFQFLEKMKLTCAATIAAMSGLAGVSVNAQDPASGWM